MPRRFPIFQFPNRPLIVAMLGAAVERFSGRSLPRVARIVSRLGLLVWSGEEVTTGANWFRRLLGVLGAAYVMFDRMGARFQPRR
jgi:hypothetical protein